MRAIIPLILVVASSGLALAQLNGMQKWTSVDGKTVEAEFVSFDKKTKVTTLRRNGKEFQVPRDRFDDRTYDRLTAALILKSRQERIRKLELEAAKEQEEIDRIQQAKRQLEMAQALREGRFFEVIESKREVNSGVCVLTYHLKNTYGPLVGAGFEFQGMNRLGTEVNASTLDGTGWGGGRHSYEAQISQPTDLGDKLKVKFIGSGNLEVIKVRVIWVETPEERKWIDGKWVTFSI